MNMRNKCLIAFLVFGLLGQAGAATQDAPVGFFSRAWHALTDKRLLGVTAAAIAGFIGWRWYRARQAQKAEWTSPKEPNQTLLPAENANVNATDFKSTNKHASVAQLPDQKTTAKSQPVQQPADTPQTQHVPLEIPSSTAPQFAGSTPIQDENLSCAASHGNVKLVNTLLAQGADVNAADESGYTPLHLASKNGHPEVVKELLLKGADVNATGHIAKDTALHLAAKNGHLKVVEFLLQQEEIKVNAIDKHERTPLHLASEKDHLEVVGLLLQQEKIKVNAKNKEDKTLLLLASENNHPEVVGLLLQHKGVNVNATDSSVKDTALHLAARNGHLEVVKKLLQKEGIKVDAIGKYNCTPLHLASENDHSAVVVLLLNQGADVNAVDTIGNTPLHYAAQFNNKDVVDTLLRYQANPGIKNSDDQLPHELAKNQEVHNLLLNAYQKKPTEPV